MERTISVNRSEVDAKSADINSSYGFLFFHHFDSPFSFCVSDRRWPVATLEVNRTRWWIDLALPWRFFLFFFLELELVDGQSDDSLCTTGCNCSSILAQRWSFHFLSFRHHRRGPISLFSPSQRQNHRTRSRRGRAPLRPLESAVVGVRWMPPSLTKF